MSEILKYLEEHAALFVAIGAIAPVLGGTVYWIIRVIWPPKPPVDEGPKALELTGRWMGTCGSVYDGRVFDLHAHLQLVNAQVQGQIEWTLKEAPPGSPLAKRVGKSGFEIVKGYLEKQRLFLTGISVDDDKLLSTSDYVVELDEKQKKFEGETDKTVQGGPSGSLQGSLAVLR